MVYEVERNQQPERTDAAFCADIAPAPNPHLGHHRVGMMLIALGRRIPAQCSTKLVWDQTCNMQVLFQSIHTGRVQFQFPRARIIVTVGSN